MPTGPGASRIFRIATATCKRMGLATFKAGSKGKACRSRIAEGIARKRRRSK